MKWKIKDEPRFIVWDGEGTNDEAGQNYSLLGCSDRRYIVGRNLSTDECLDFILAKAKQYPESYHVSFAFDYDVNMILRDLTTQRFDRLAKHGKIAYRGYFIEHIPHKWFRVTKRGVGSVKIQDTWAFFQSSFLAAVNSYLVDHPIMDILPTVEEGKAERGAFSYAQVNRVIRYWKAEIAMGEALVNKLWELLNGQGFRITKWHGPGAIAEYVYETNGVKLHRDSKPTERIVTASRYAYAGGRFELFHVGRFKGPVYGIDINSAYPDAIRHLPSLSEGRWDEWDGEPIDLYGCYRVTWDASILESTGYDKMNRYMVPAMPLFHRTPKHTILYPIETSSWYWGPELLALLEQYPHALECGALTIHEGFVRRGWKTKPFAFVETMYEERRRLKAAGNPGQVALKLALNSLYGKMAQRAGFGSKLERDEDGKHIFPSDDYWDRIKEMPKWHQLEWAGWVTSYARAKIYSVISRLPHEDIIAVETDGIYTTFDPRLIGIVPGKELGGWDFTEYDEMVYLQNGMYAKRQGDQWTYRSRGAEKYSLDAEDFLGLCIQLDNSPLWPVLTVETNRFLGYFYALTKGEDFKNWHCRWLPIKRLMNLDGNSKRTHVSQYCMACQTGQTGYELAHTLTYDQLFSRWTGESGMHDLPWLTDEEAWWRAPDELNASLLSLDRGT